MGKKKDRPALIASLPQVHREELLKEVIEHPYVAGVRYNTGTRSAYNPLETIRRIQKYALPLNKPVWVDLKGKQLRVIEWADLPYGPILLNHRVKVEMPATVYFRGDDGCELKKIVNGNEIYVDPLPKEVVGRGQSVNILSPNLEIEDGLLELDHLYIQAALSEGVGNFMLSFVENWNDVRQLEKAVGSRGADICLKIESQQGLDFVQKTKPFELQRYQLMAARDDLMIQIGLLKMPGALRAIIKKDPKAIGASRLLLGAENEGISLADLLDLEYMKMLGYRNFMLSDGISHRHFSAAIKFWEEYILALTETP